MLSSSGRQWAASQRVRGAYRAGGWDSLAPYRVRRKGGNREKASGRVAVVAGVCGASQKMFMHKIEGKWGADQATEMYEHLRRFLEKEYPGRKRWRLIEDNDPSGLQCKKAVLAKRRLGFLPLFLPKRSPDLSLMDYAVWDNIVGKLRSQEKKMEGKESRQKFLGRVARAIKGANKRFLKDSQQSMKRRLRAVIKARGGLFEE